MNRNVFTIALFMASLAILPSCSKDEEDDDNPSGPKLISAIVETDKAGKDSTSLIYTDGVLTSAEYFNFEPGAIKTYSREYIYKSGKLVNIVSYKWNGTTRTPEDKDSLTYDSKNRIEKEFDFNYSNNKFELSDNITTYEYNPNNQPIKFSYGGTEYNTFAYDGNGNVETINEYYYSELDDTDTYIFDTQKNPFKGSPYAVGEAMYYNTNNFTKSTDKSGNVVTRTYEYNAEGYPTKITTSYEETGHISEPSVYYIYYK